MPSDLHPCADQQIASRVAYSDGGMSKKNYRVEMTNVSSDPCIMRGFPGVDHRGADGSPVGAPATRDNTGVRTVEVAAGQTVSANLRTTDPGVFDAAACQPVAVAGFNVWIPNGTQLRVADLPHQACGNPAFASMSVGPAQGA